MVRKATECAASDTVGRSQHSPLRGRVSEATEVAHDPYRRVADLLQRLAPGKMRIGFFLGSGCPLSIQIPAVDKTKALIPEINELTQRIKTFLDKDKDLNVVAQMAWDRVVARGIAMPTIEDVLSHIRTLQSVCGDTEIDGFDKDLLIGLDDAICRKVRDIVGKDRRPPALSSGRL